jgi:UDP-N-acetylmuramoyl-tripeptide--D-alanyl-D-alanine ligase
MELRQLASGVTLLDDSYNANPDSTRAALDALARFECDGRRIAVLGEMLELGESSEVEHRMIGKYAADRADVVLAVGPGARPIAAGAEDRTVVVVDNDAAVDWLRVHLAADDVVLVKASRAARLDEVAAALA